LPLLDTFRPAIFGSSGLQESENLSGVVWTFQSVFIVRHGQTEWNRLGRRQGQLDSPLSSTGIRQADALARHVMALEVDGIFTSPLGRARATAAVIGAHVGVAVQTVADLAEIHHGEFAGLTNREIEERYPGALSLRAANKYTWQFPGGESYQDADRRAHRALDMVQASGSRRPLLVTHEMTGLMLLRQLLDLTADEALRRAIPHGHVLEAVPSAAAVHEHAVE
jgi:broad specificity phosphatase PhoE